MSVEPHEQLAGQSILITRAAEQAPELAQLLGAAGAKVLEVPTLVIVPVRGGEAAELERAARDVAAGAYDGVVFTSTNAVGFFLAVLAEQQAVPRLAEVACFAIGPATARALTSRGLVAPVVAAEAVSESLLAAIQHVWGDAIAGKRLLLPRAREGREVLAQGLRAAGVAVETVVVYETRPVVAGPPLPTEPIDWTTFASPSAARAFQARFGKPPGRIACIGPVTAAAVRELGWTVDAVAADHTASGLVAAIIAQRGV